MAPHSLASCFKEHRPHAKVLCPRLPSLGCSLQSSLDKALSQTSEKERLSLWDLKTNRAVLKPDWGVRVGLRLKACSVTHPGQGPSAPSPASSLATLM